METTIQVSKELLGKLVLMKMHEKESYESVIWDLIEDRMEFSKETMKNIEKSESEINAGKTIPFEQIKKNNKRK